ncbi:MAG TPA: MerR family transcriptional regulator [Acidimicrobiales bacterium]|nr:MerR family transcriptional regulator [Acidimicrobiales bacterium]
MVATRKQSDTDGLEAGFRGPQVCSIVGITYRQLDYWARTDLLRPSVSEAKGSGSQRRYSYEDLVALKVIKRLLDAGISLQLARRAVECLRAAGEELATADLVIDEGRTVLAHSGEEIVDLLRGGQGVLNVVAMQPLVSEVAAAITSLRDARAPERSDAADRGDRSPAPTVLRAAGD